jgi:hypothetical protein
MNFETTARGTMSTPQGPLGGVKAWAIMFLCPSERSDEAAPGLTFGPRIEGAAPKNGNQVAVK